MTGQGKTLGIWLRGAGGLALLLGGLAGCAAYDDFSWRKMNFEVFKDSPQPLEVIKTSTDGSARARAFRCLKEPLTNGGVYVARLSAAFAPLWSRRFGGLGNTDVLGVATDDGGNVLLAGDYAGTVDFGGGPFQSAGEYDAFVLKLSP